MTGRGARAAAGVLAVLALSPPPAAARPTLRVASKAFAESVILGEIVTQAERAAGVPAEHRPGLGGTRLVWDSLINGAVDVYPEYTGTIVQEILPALSSADAGPSGRERLARALASQGVGMTAPLGFENTYAIGMVAARARALGVARLSDLRAHPELTFAFSNEFMSRRDGWPALRQRYQLPQDRVQGLDHDLAERALGDGTIDATDIYTTDAEIRRLGLVALADDAGFFARYDAVLLYRLDIGQRIGPQAVAALHRLEGRIDAATMVSLNARAKIDHVSEAGVAAGFLGTTAAAGSRGLSVRAIGARVVEHLELVGISLLAAIILAVPLGVLAAKRPRLGQSVLAVTGVVQTVPALALLVFMIPLFGIGTVPAVVALFLYGLLPIVRNTHAGIAGIPGSVRESAEALGLPPGAILRLVELPLASPLIFAGVQSAAVINVGAATLGALIGAGGLGQPIFTGIRLDDVGLVLAGAVPASLLALAVQALFELLARLLIPRGLRARRPR
ncbi:MAG TPA: glycine betaine ABC transporter substrate-binding protein [Polyangia bacterium]|nr:glycine betaine ABC transporter substrate-binding protein [Polyangia bacterium]